MKKLSAVYLKAPQGYQIAKKQKTLIVSPVKSEDYIDKNMYIVSGDKIYAKVKLMKPYSMNHTLFKKTFEKHKVSEATRKKHWSDVKQFWAYTFKLLASYNPPIYCGKLDKPGLFIDNVEPEKINEVRLYNGKKYHTFKLADDEVLVKIKADAVEEELNMEGHPSFKLFSAPNIFIKSKGKKKTKKKKKWKMKNGKLVYC